MCLRTRASPEQVPEQHNGYDCGLYMLRFIDKLARVQPDLSKHQRARPPYKQKWAEFVKEHEDLFFDAKQVDVRRKEMALEIEAYGKTQKKERLQQQGDEEEQKEKKPKLGA